MINKTLSVSSLLLPYCWTVRVGYDNTGDEIVQSYIHFSNCLFVGGKTKTYKLKTFCSLVFFFFGGGGVGQYFPYVMIYKY